MQNRLILPRKAHSRGIYPAELVLPGISRREIHMETRIILREAAAGGRGRPLVGQDHTGQTADGPKETDPRRRTQGDGTQETDPEHNYSSHPVRGSDVFDDQR